MGIWCPKRFQVHQQDNEGPPRQVTWCFTAKTGDYMGIHEGKDEWTIKKWWLYIYTYMIIWFYQSSWGLIKGYYMSKNGHWSTIQKNAKDGNTICIDSCGLVKGSTIKDGDEEWRSSKNIIWMVIGNTGIPFGWVLKWPNSLAHWEDLLYEAEKGEWCYRQQPACTLGIQGYYI